MPVVEWKTYASIGRLRAQAGDYSAAQQAFIQAKEIVSKIADNINNDELRAVFLNSSVVGEVIERAHKTESI